MKATSAPSTFPSIVYRKAKCKQTFGQRSKKYLEAEGFALDPFDPKATARILLMLDGLDELSMQGDNAAQAASDFISRVGKALESLNRDAARILTLIGLPRIFVAGD